MVQTYWNIGKRIVEQEQGGKARADYGDFLISNLSRYLTDIFGRGFSEANLWNFRQFYSVFPQFSTQCVENLTWTNIRLIMRLDNADERDWYMKEAVAGNWSSRLLERNIKSGYYRRLLSSGKEKKARFSSAVEFIKDPYILEFLDVSEDLSGKENALESAIIGQLQKFMLELGRGFSFVARHAVSARKHHTSI
jgi:predicted nuclease of restriction endonuclease-like (RecB) superfamily